MQKKSAQVPIFLINNLSSTMIEYPWYLHLFTSPLQCTVCGLLQLVQFHNSLFHISNQQIRQILAG